MLDSFITTHRDEIISRCRAKVATRSLPPPTEVEINHGVPLFLDQLVTALRDGSHRPGPDIVASALLHGHDLLRQGFTVSQVVHDYGDICQSVTELALETNAPIATSDFRMLNQCLDDAIAGAVTTFQRESQRALSEQATNRSDERVGFLVHELRNLVNTATVAFEILQTGRGGVTGNTGAVLKRSLEGLRALIAGALEDVRVARNPAKMERISVSDLIAEVADAATPAAHAADVTFVVMPVDRAVTITADPKLMAAVLANLLQNAFKFTVRQSTVTLRVGASAQRVLIQVEDQCGGLPGGDSHSEELFRPFEQRGADRTGMGIGLAFSRWGAEANNGRVYARNLDQGCVFTVDLPRAEATAVTTVP
jgi:signal transduction histidine kinase